MKRLFIHSKATFSPHPDTAYGQQIRYLARIWQDDSYGLERITRLFLCLTQFLFPILLIRHVCTRWGLLSRKLAIEAYTLLKVLLPLYILASGLYHHKILICIIVYLLGETVIHLLSHIFLSDLYPDSASYTRAILLLFLHYFEVVLDFAVIYIGLGVLSREVTWLTAIYFSLVVNTTVGFGEIHAWGQRGQTIVIFQLLIGVLFVTIFINYFSGRVNEKSGKGG